MPVHNAGPFLDEAIESILEQSFTEFEFVILDDASTDGSTFAAVALQEWEVYSARAQPRRYPSVKGAASASCSAETR